MNFKNSWKTSEQMYKKSKFFKLRDIITISNLKYAYNQLNTTLPWAFENFFICKDSQHLCNTRGNLVFHN